MFLNKLTICCILQILIGQLSFVSADCTMWDSLKKTDFKMDFGKSDPKTELWEFTDWNVTLPQLDTSCGKKFKVQCHMPNPNELSKKPCKKPCRAEKHFIVDYNSNPPVHKIDFTKNLEYTTCSECKSMTITNKELSKSKQVTKNDGTTTFRFGPGVDDDMVKLGDVTKNSVTVNLNTDKNKDCSGVNYKIKLTNEDKTSDNPVQKSSNGGTIDFGNLQNCSNYKLKVWPIYQSKNGIAITKK